MPARTIEHVRSYLWTVARSNQPDETKQESAAFSTRHTMVSELLVRYEDLEPGKLPGPEVFDNISRPRRLPTSWRMITVRTTLSSELNNPVKRLPT